MQYMRMLIVMTATIIVAAGSSRGSTSPGPLLPDNAAGSASVWSSSPLITGERSLSKTIIPAAQESTVAQLFVASTAEGGDDDEKKPRSRSVHCPPDKDDHHDFSYRDDDHKGDNDKDKDKDKDHHDRCGKGDDDKNP